MVSGTTPGRPARSRIDPPAPVLADAQGLRTADPLVAFVDESSRRLGSTGDLTGVQSGGHRARERIYLLAAAICRVSACDDLRADLRGLLLRGQQRLHWRDESEERRRSIAAGFAAMSTPAALRSVVVAVSSVPDNKQERARRLCLEALHPTLQGLGVTAIVQEQRTPQQNRHDLRMVDALRGQRLLGPGVRVQFAQPVTEPLLWLPDAIAGAVGLARDGRPAHLDTLTQDYVA